MSTEQHRSSLWWAALVTIGTAVVAVLLVQWMATALITSPPPFLTGYAEPAVITAVLVSLSVVVFAVVTSESERPVRTFRRVAFVALLISLIPDVGVGMGWAFPREGWTLASVFIAQHVAAWAVVVILLPRLVVRR